ncbi:MAG TPA: peptidase M19, partial [Sphingopyxis sp.]|nr:peptidase M19 [Sphingopyxis sp.]
MRRWLIRVLLLLLIGWGAFFALAPGIVERGLNQIDGKPLPPVSERARALHETLTIVDLHSDSLLWSRDFLKRAGRGHMDLPRLQD